MTIEPGEGLSLPDRVYRLYETLLERDETDLDIEAEADASFPERHLQLVKAICERLAGLLALDGPPSEPTEMLRVARRKLREAKTDPAAPQIKSAIDRLALNLRLGPYAFRGQGGDAGGTRRAHQAYPQRLLQRHDARHYEPLCAASSRPRTAIIRVPDAIPMHGFEGSVDEALVLLRRRMQEALDGINGMLKTGERLKTYPIPSTHLDPQTAKVAS